MMDIRKRLFIIVGLIVGLLIALILAIVLSSGDEAQEGAPVGGTEQPGGPSASPRERVEFIPEDKPLPPEPPADAERRYVGQLAGIFVERFGSYSNQNSNLHIEDIKELATTQMGRWIDTQLVEQGDVYAGITTRVISTSIDAYTGSTASVTLGVQQVLTTNGDITDVYKTARVELIKSGATWLVNAVYFEE